MAFRFTAEMDVFLEKNAPLLAWPELTALFGERFSVSVSKNTIQKHCQTKWHIYKTDRRGCGHRYTEEQLQWILDHADLKYQDMTDGFNAYFCTDVSRSGITQQCERLGVKKIERHSYTQEEIQWLTDHLQDMTWEQLHKEFCKRFDVRVSRKRLNQMLYERGILKIPRHHWTNTERQFLKENNDKYTLPELTERFNQYFGLELSYGAITQQCQTFLGLRRGENTFQATEVPAGTEVVKNDGKYSRIMVKMPGAVRGQHRKAWRKKAEVIYEQLHGPIPENGRVIHLDGNFENFDADNLYCIDARIQACLSLHKWWTDSKEHTLAAIKWCELFYAMKDRSAE